MKRSSALAVPIAAVLLLAASPATTRGGCPGGRLITVSHIAKGRPQVAEEQLTVWITGMKDCVLGDRVQASFQGKICVGDDGLLDQLNTMARTAKPELRAEAIHVLCFYGGPTALQTVRKAIQDGSPSVRMKALSCAAYLCDKSALPQIEDLLTWESTPEVVPYAREVAERLRGTLPCTPMPADAGSDE